MSGGVAVRMYNVGFGDAFLLRFPAPDRPRKVLIDCGFHAAGPGPHEIRDVVDRIVADVTEGGVPRIDVVVATHRHRDHVYGFEQKAWKNVHVSEVWMPWTEHPTDPEARRVRQAQARKARRLLAAFRVLALSAERRRLLIELVENSAEWKNAAAMNMLRNGFQGTSRIRYLPVEGSRPSLRPRRLPGVRVHVLGPSRAESVIRDMDPPEDESFLRMGVGVRGGRPRSPFHRRLALSPSGAAFERWLAGHARGRRGGAPLAPGEPGFARWWVTRLGLTPRRLRAVERAAEDDPFLAAVALDKAVNGTSLMLMFEMGRAHLLFPGDAQWGTWDAAMREPRSRELLGKTTFYKVGHHGSHNATPQTFVHDIVPRNFLAMVPTRATTRFPEIPRRPLLKELGKKARRIARSDAVPTAPFRQIDDVAIEATVPT